jgi:hypothetical protein
MPELQMNLNVSDFEFRITTDKGDIDVTLDFASGDAWLVGVSGILESWTMDGYDEHYQCNHRGPCDRWDVLGWVASTAEARGARVLDIRPLEERVNEIPGEEAF